MTAQNIYNDLKAGDNSKLWGYAKEIHESRKKIEKSAKKKTDIDLNDKEGLKETVMAHLFEQSSRGNAQASDKLARLAGLSESTSDITIESVDFSKVEWQPSV